MSEYGLHITNDSGQVLIDSTYENLMLRDSKSVSSNSGTNASDYVSFSGRDTPVVVMGGTGGAYPALKWTQKSGSEYRYQVVSDSGHTIDYYAFDTPGEPTDHDYGVKVWAEDGTPVFNSAYPYLRIIDTFTVDTAGSEISKSYSVPVGVILNRSWQKIITVPVPGSTRSNYIATGIKISGKNITTKQVTLKTAYGDDNAVTPDTVPILVVDITGL